MFFFVVVASIILVIVNKTIKYSVFVDTGAELNIIIADVADRAGLAIKTRVKVKILLYSEYINRFLEMIENILISVDSIACGVNIFVTRSTPYSLILKIPYLHSTRAQLLFDEDSMQVLFQSINK